MQTWRTLSEIFPLALLAAGVIATLIGILGVFVILKRMVFLGAVLSELASLGLALTLVTGLPPLIGATVSTVIAGLILSRPFETARIPRDAVLGVLFVAAAAGSILLAAHTGLGLEEVKNLLYGDLIIARHGDVIALLCAAIPLVALLLAFRLPILYAFLDRDAARLLGVRVDLWEALFFVGLSLIVALASRTAGAMLIFAYLVVPSTTALMLSRRLARVLTVAALHALLATMAGLYMSLALDWPTNPTIIAAVCVPLPLAAMIRRLRN